MLMSCTPPRTPSPGTVTSMPVSVIMIGKKDGTAEPVVQQHQEHQQQLQQQPKKKQRVEYDDEMNREKIMNDGPALTGRQVIFVENKDTNRHLRNANFGMEQIFVANKDTNRETGPDLAVNKLDFQHFLSRSSPSLINCPVPELPGTSQVLAMIYSPYFSFISSSTLFVLSRY